MKIVMFTDAYWPRINGVTVSVDSFSRSLIKAGHQVLIICSSYPATDFAANGDQEQEGDPRIVRVPSMPAFITKEDRIAKFNKWFWVFKQVESFDPDIIHINTEIMIAEFGFLYAKAHNLPAIYTFHTMWEDYAESYFPLFPPVIVRFFIRGILKNILRRSYRVIVPTPQIETVVRKYKFKRETFLLPTGIDPDLFVHDPAEISRFREKLETRYPALKGKRILLFAGRVAKEKNLGFLLEILPGILAQHPDTALLIIGNGPDLDYFEEEAAGRGVAEQCVFTGYMERKYLALAYSISEIFVFPSLTETQGLVTLEAMFSGIPVVAIGEMGTIMVMGGDNGGFMVRNDTGEFTRRVLELMDDSELYDRKALEAKEHARSWSIDAITRRLEGVYEKVIAAYSEEYGERRLPVWELMIDKRWWKENNKKLQKITNKKWHEMKMKWRH
ncbi:MAG: glycosyltransferase [Treponema sp.]|jgi:glycosyltransferase involved in cell wall biosynthesis|nr:glycosyltransferase [Treponema sp.]